jgi:hypothetical protein
MVNQPQKEYWRKHKGECHRQSVEKEVLNFMGCKELEQLINAAEDLPTLRTRLT